MDPSHTSSAATPAGEVRSYGAKDSFELQDDTAAWRVEAGLVDIFLLDRQSASAGLRHHVLSVPMGAFMFGVPLLRDQRVSLLVVPGNDTQLRRCKMEELSSSNDEVVSSLEKWVQALSAAMEEPELAAACKEIESADGRLVVSGLAAFHQNALPFAAERFRAVQSAELAALEAGESLRQQTMGGAIGRLVDTIKDHRVGGTSSMQPLFAACELVVADLDLKVVLPHGGVDAIAASPKPVELIAAASKLQSRDVTLSDTWWKRSEVPLVAQWSDGRPCALIPRLLGGYDAVDPLTLSRVRVDAGVAKRLLPTAVQFFESLPDRALKLSDMLGFVIKRTGMDIVTITVMILLVGTLSLAPPMATRVLFDSIIPSNQPTQAAVVGAIIFICAAAVALMALVQAIGILRIEGRMDMRLQAALWDRLLRAPTSFFRQHSSGDLVSRMQSVESVRKILTGSVINSIVGGIMGTFSFALMLYFAPLLSLILAAVVFLFAFVGFLLGWRLVTLDRQALVLGGKLQSLTVQLLDMVAKLRMAAMEDIAFQRWVRMFLGVQAVMNKNAHAQVLLVSIMAMLGTISLAVLFTVIGVESGTLLAYFQIPTTWAQITGHELDVVMSLPDFAAYVTAFIQFITAMTGLMLVAIRLSAVQPLIGRLRPLLEMQTEQFGARENPGELAGGIEFKNVSFRYQEDGPLILDGLSFRAEPGEFIAFVGPSGSGKSSTIRLLLGFETPEAGSIHLDNHELSTLDKALVREQLGVVIQDGKLLPGTVFENLTGDSGVSVEDAWEAARQAGFEKDVQQMPQGMDTVIADGAANISGGQRQRLLIARALIRKPRILVFDEATSALDNETQEIVSRTIENMRVTRIAVAHRLSTIIRADRIFVIVAGKVVESGSYQELMARGEVFAELVRRQT
ncbi:NHLP bacteriocin export ABC transporter permease/ATPase subunit [Ottowia thiooxydans]|uniref:NHLP bacteriocin export ABC transporter permease/ATPase subunit n=1 Tax=Ottowia thiooxydans TaxID=219182 RepID=UPI0003F6DF05|nr:NHLP bacteriocin export ABC transporter permease/ATPase subunit [Ottowia thiooxydans]